MPNSRQRCLAGPLNRPPCQMAPHESARSPLLPGGAWPLGSKQDGPKSAGSLAIQSRPRQNLPSRSAKPKRKLSEAGRANIVAALKKRWAAQKAAAKKAGPAAAKKVAVKKAAKKKGGPAKKAKAAKKTVAAQTATGVAGE
ncbi:hypothetical protein SBA3_2530006 [Candidatus Sulfopaludibacter sp. SbA3]|nr:hypothetical protein SBA3_2530006 [Candidatus Sulfopaludibacter sp. SbA3]